jgi:hypothetical protein
MNDRQKTALRAAVLVHEQMAGRGGPTRSIYLPEHSWENILRLKRQIERAQQRRWLRAAEVLARELADCLRYLPRELENAARAVAIPAQPAHLSTPSEIFRDLLAMDEEFDEIETDLKTHEICATTETIVLEGIRLGAFQIRLDWQQLGRGHHPYRVVALDPHPAARNEDVTHPHVQGEQLCEGEGRAAIAAALAECRLSDFFLLVSQLLHTYGRGNAYVELSHWEGVPCDDCGQSVDEDERYYCHRCDNTLCDSCAATCEQCQRSYCAACLQKWPTCGWDYCASCLRACPVCSKRFCEDCREGDLCRSCYEQQRQEEPEDDLREDERQSQQAGLAAQDGRASACITA